jgi:polyphosphate glucokinase
MQALGIDIGGTGIKGAPVDLATGKLLTDRKKIATPHPATPDAVTEVVKEVAQSFGWTGVVGATFPGVVISGTIRSAANVDKTWIGTDAASLFRKALGAELHLGEPGRVRVVEHGHVGAGAGVDGSVLMLTFGTGVGSALFSEGVLVRNTEFGHIEIRGKDAEKRASEHAKLDHDWGWTDWTARVSEYLQRMEALLSPNLIIVGGGISKECGTWLPMLTGIQAQIVPATLHNDAGIVGAAMAAWDLASAD